MTRDEVIAILEKHRLPLPVGPAEATGATVAFCNTTSFGTCILVLTDNRIVYWRRPGELLFLTPECNAETLTLLCDYTRDLACSPDYPRAKAALSEFTKAKCAAFDAEREASERRQLAKLKAKYEEMSA